MAKVPKKDWYWPLGVLDYAHEIHESYPDEAELIGAITILWNRQELELRRIFLALLSARQPAYAAAIWDRQPTHQARRDLLALALQTVKLSKRNASMLLWVIDKTKTVADRRNELIHAEYVVHARTDQLHAKVSAPRSNKPPKHQKVAASDLRVVEEDLVHLLQTTEAVWMELTKKTFKRITAGIERLVAEREQSRENPQSD